MATITLDIKEINDEKIEELYEELYIYTECSECHSDLDNELKYSKRGKDFHLTVERCTCDKE